MTFIFMDEPGGPIPRVVAEAYMAAIMRGEHCGGCGATWRTPIELMPLGQRVMEHDPLCPYTAALGAYGL